MILKADALSPIQKTVIEEILGRRVQEAEAISLRAFVPPTPSPLDRQAAADKLRIYLELADCPPANAPNDECEAVLLEALRSERPNYTPVS